MATLSLTIIDFIVADIISPDHISTDWEIASDNSFNNIIFQSLNDSNNLYTLVHEYNYENDVYVRIKLNYTTGSSNWSSVKHVKDFLPTVIEEPSVNIPDISGDINTGFTIYGGKFTLVQGTDTHIATDWIIKDLSGNVVWESINNPTNLESINVHTGSITPETDYIAEVTYYGTVNSATSTHPFTVINRVENMWVKGTNLNHIVTVANKGWSELEDGRLFITGGISSGSYAHDKVHIYNPRTDDVEVRQSLPIPMRDHAQATGKDGNIYIFGGHRYNNYVTNSALKYIMHKDLWVSVKNVPTTLAYPQAATRENGLIVIYEGVNANTLYQYDPSVDEWEILPSSPRSFTGWSMSLMKSDELLVIRSWGGSPYGREAYKFNFDTNTWIRVADLPRSDIYGSLTLTNSGKLIATTSSSTYLTVYDPDTDSWSYKTGSHSALGSHPLTGILDNNVVYYIKPTSNASNPNAIREWYYLDDDLR
jgi:hypothetical protein